MAAHRFQDKQAQNPPQALRGLRQKPKDSQLPRGGGPARELAAALLLEMVHNILHYGTAPLHNLRLKGRQALLDGMENRSQHDGLETHEQRHVLASRRLQEK